MNLLVGSVFLDHPRSGTWFRLQQKYLRRTVQDFKHVVYLNGTETSIYEASLVGTNKDRRAGSEEHVYGLNALLEYFKGQDFDYYLLLDSDCFPFRKGWQASLIQSMAAGGFEIAAPVRFENLDTFAHPSAFFFSRKALEGLKFSVGRGTNLLGKSFDDSLSNADKFFPLLRTNKLNHHPILCGVYWNTFYHHGAGSRSLAFRSVDMGYYNGMSEDAMRRTEQGLYEQLNNHTDWFLENISGLSLKAITCFL